MGQVRNEGSSQTPAYCVQIPRRPESKVSGSL